VSAQAGILFDTANAAAVADAAFKNPLRELLAIFFFSSERHPAVCGPTHIPCRHGFRRGLTSNLNRLSADDSVIAAHSAAPV